MKATLINMRLWHSGSNQSSWERSSSSQAQHLERPTHSRHSCELHMYFWNTDHVMYSEPGLQESLFPCRVRNPCSLVVFITSNNWTTVVTTLTALRKKPRKDMSCLRKRIPKRPRPQYGPVSSAPWLCKALKTLSAPCTWARSGSPSPLPSFMSAPRCTSSSSKASDSMCKPQQAWRGVLHVCHALLGLVAILHSDPHHLRGSGSHQQGLASGTHLQGFAPLAPTMAPCHHTASTRQWPVCQMLPWPKAMGSSPHFFLLPPAALQLLRLPHEILMGPGHPTDFGTKFWNIWAQLWVTEQEGPQTIGQSSHSKKLVFIIGGTCDDSRSV